MRPQDPDRALIVAAAFEMDGYYLFTPHHWTDGAALERDRDTARRAAERQGWAVGTVTTQRDRHGCVSVYAMVFDGPDDLALRLFERLGLPTTDDDETGPFLDDHRRGLRE